MCCEHILYQECHTWGENTLLDHSIDVQTNSLDVIVKELNLPKPDIFGMDIQGAEYATLIGAKSLLKNEIICIVTEIEFSEIYDGQGLFHEQHSLLNKNGFRLVDIMSQQFWHPSPAIGKGFNCW